MALLDFLVGPVMDIVNKLVPDPQAKMQAQIQLLQLQQTDEFKQMDFALQQSQMQTDINKTEASNASVFVSGWRPFIGWTCGVGFASQFVVFPLIFWGGELFGKVFTMPQLPTETLVTMLGGMLGIGTMHTYEKVKGVVKGAG